MAAVAALQLTAWMLVCLQQQLPVKWLKLFSGSPDPIYMQRCKDAKVKDEFNRATNSNLVHTHDDRNGGMLWPKWNSGSWGCRPSDLPLRCLIWFWASFHMDSLNRTRSQFYIEVHEWELCCYRHFLTLTVKLTSNNIITHLYWGLSLVIRLPSLYQLIAGFGSPDAGQLIENDLLTTELTDSVKVVNPSSSGGTTNSTIKGGQVWRKEGRSWWANFSQQFSTVQTPDYYLWPGLWCLPAG